MYSPFQLAVKYGRYYIAASNGKGHGIHSPFVFEFVRRVLNDKRAFDSYSIIESSRKKALADNRLVKVDDFGAGSSFAPSSRTVASIAANAAKAPKAAQLLFRLAHYYKPAYIVELGTSLGISTAYLASGNKEAAVVTAEGSGEVARLARQRFEELTLPGISIVTGDFDRTLPQILHSVPFVDMAFIDGNHREAPTLHYFNLFLQKMSPDSMIVFDDIHWSSEMESAWQKIKDHPSAMCTVDLFFMGIVFFRPGFKVKQHFTIRF
jgi:predicted O-methyltransferase YrrM